MCCQDCQKAYVSSSRIIAVHQVNGNPVISSTDVLPTDWARCRLISIMTKVRREARTIIANEYSLVTPNTKALTSLSAEQQSLPNAAL